MNDSLDSEELGIIDKMNLELVKQGNPQPLIEKVNGRPQKPAIRPELGAPKQYKNPYQEFTKTLREQGS